MTDQEYRLLRAMQDYPVKYIGFSSFPHLDPLIEHNACMSWPNAGGKEKLRQYEQRHVTVKVADLQALAQLAQDTHQYYLAECLQALIAGQDIAQVSEL